MKKNIITTIIQGMAVTALFLVTEIVLNLFGVFNEDIRLYLVDISLRLLFGTVALVLLARNFKKQEHPELVKKLFTNKLPGSTYVLLLPFTLYLLVTLLLMVTGEAKELGDGFVGMYSLNCGQQLATGYFEEATRALLMCGLLKYCMGTKKNRIQTILVAGICFGLSHALNFFFGQGVIATLWQVFHCFLWGLFAAAIYILSKNLTLLMVMHAVWDIVIRIPDNFCNFAGNSVLRDVLYILQDVLDYGIMPIAAVYICIRYEKLRGRNQEEREPI